jgi:hypothetical protein
MNDARDDHMVPEWVVRGKDNGVDETRGFAEEA